MKGFVFRTGKCKHRQKPDSIIRYCKIIGAQHVLVLKSYQCHKMRKKSVSVTVHQTNKSRWLIIPLKCLKIQG